MLTILHSEMKCMIPLIRLLTEKVIVHLKYEKKKWKDYKILNNCLKSPDSVSNQAQV